MGGLTSSTAVWFVVGQSHQLLSVTHPRLSNDSLAMAVMMVIRSLTAGDARANGAASGVPWCDSMLCDMHAPANPTQDSADDLGQARFSCRNNKSVST